MSTQTTSLVQLRENASSRVSQYLAQLGQVHQVQEGKHTTPVQEWGSHPNYGPQPMYPQQQPAQQPGFIRRWGGRALVAGAGIGAGLAAAHYASKNPGGVVAGAVGQAHKAGGFVAKHATSAGGWLKRNTWDRLKADSNAQQTQTQGYELEGPVLAESILGIQPNTEDAQIIASLRAHGLSEEAIVHACTEPQDLNQSRAIAYFVALSEGADLHSAVNDYLVQLSEAPNYMAPAELQAMHAQMSQHPNAGMPSPPTLQPGPMPMAHPQMMYMPQKQGMSTLAKVGIGAAGLAAAGGAGYLLARKYGGKKEKEAPAAPPTQAAAAPVAVASVPAVAPPPVTGPRQTAPKPGSQQAAHTPASPDKAELGAAVNSKRIALLDKAGFTGPKDFNSFTAKNPEHKAHFTLARILASVQHQKESAAKGGPDYLGMGLKNAHIALNDKAVKSLLLSMSGPNPDPKAHALFQASGITPSDLADHLSKYPPKK